MKLLYLPNQYSQQRQFQKPVWVYPVLMAMEAQWYRNQGHDVDWNPIMSRMEPFTFEPLTDSEEKYDKIIKKPEGLDFLSLPIPDRQFTMAFDKRYQLYGNYQYHPATHMQVADGCWHGKCTFCVENKKNYFVRSMESVMEEIDQCHTLGFREIFDDSGTFPDGKWLTEFCIKMMQRPYKMVLGCNMRIGADVDFKLMKQAGFRMLLYGIESANQKTLTRIKKGVNSEDVIPTLRRASDAGLEPHIAVMFGYPWETEKEETETLKLVHYCLRKGYAKTAQASVYAPEGKAYNAKIKSSGRLVGRIYDAVYYPSFWYHQLCGIRSFEDAMYLLKKIRKGIVRD